MSECTELLRRVQSRLDTFGDGRDPAVILGSAAIEDVTRLLERCPEDVEAVIAAARLHWIRADVAPDIEREDEIRRAAELFSSVVHVAADQVPPELLPLLVGNEPDEKAERWRQEFARFCDTDRPEYLDLAIDALRELLSDAPDADAASWGNLAALLRDRAVRTVDPACSDINEAIDIGEALAEQLVDDQGRAPVLNNLAASFLVRFERRGDVADLDEAAGAAARAVDCTPAGQPGRAIYLSNYSAILLDRFRHCAKDVDIEPAVAAAREAVDQPPDGVAEHVTALATLGLALRSSYELTGRPDDLSEAVDAGRDGVRMAAAGGWADPNALVNLSQSLAQRFELTRSDEDLADAIDTGTAAVAACAPAEPVRLVCLSHLGDVLCTRFEHTGCRPDLDDAVRLLSEASGAAHDADPDLATYRLNLAYALVTRHELTGFPDDAQAAITTCRTVLAALPTTAPEWARGASLLALTLHGRYLDGSVPDLVEATVLARAAVRAGHGEQGDCGSFHSNLSTILQTRFSATADPADMDGAVESAREAVAAARFLRSRATFRSNLAAALVARFEVTGLRADLDQALKSARSAIGATPDDDTDAPRRFLNLAAVLSARFENLGTAADLADGVSAARRALEGCPDGHPLRASSAAQLSALLHAAHLRTGAIADGDEAVHAASEAVAATPLAGVERPGRLANLAAALETRAARPGMPPACVERDLTRAVEAGREALAVAAGPGRALMLNNLGATLRRRYGEFAVETDLRDAIRMGTDAVNAVPAQHPNRALYLTNLALALTEAHRLTGQGPAREEAIAHYTDAAAQETAPVRERMYAAWWGGRLAMSADDVHTATDLLAAAVGLLPRTAWHGLDRLSREGHLARAQGLAVEAAAMGIAAARVPLAVELAELGRAVLWSGAFDDGAGLARLSRGHPELAHRLGELRDLLR